MFSVLFYSQNITKHQLCFSFPQCSLFVLFIWRDAFVLLFIQLFYHWTIAYILFFTCLCNSMNQRSCKHFRWIEKKYVVFFFFLFFLKKEPEKEHWFSSCLWCVRETEILWQTVYEEKRKKRKVKKKIIEN